MSQPSLEPANIVSLDLEDDALPISTPIRETHSTSPPAKPQASPAETSNIPDEDTIVVDISHLRRLDDEADAEDEDDDDVVLTSQSRNTQNARVTRGTPKGRASSSEKRSSVKDSKLKDAGKKPSLKRKSIAKDEQSQGPSKRTASGESNPDSEKVPGLPRERLWLHSVQVPSFTPTKQSSISDFFKPPSTLKKATTTSVQANHTSKATSNIPSSPISNTDLCAAKSGSSLRTSALKSPNQKPVMAVDRPARTVSKIRKSLADFASDDEQGGYSSEQSQISDFVATSESSQDESSHGDESDASIASSEADSSEIEDRIQSSRPAKRARRFSVSPPPLLQAILNKTARKNQKQIVSAGLGADRVLFPELDEGDIEDVKAKSPSRASKPTPGPKKKPTGTDVIKPDNWAYKNGLALDLKPISKIDDIFADMADKALTKMNIAPKGKLALTKMTKAQKEKYDVVDHNDKTLVDFLDHLNGRKLRVATMCSGTESPILALNLVSEALKVDGHNFEFDHQFSAEIVPYKQAYIERNFSPPIIFRDIKELSIPDATHATTAYGSKAKIPGDIDILITGFSCVDFSGLNSAKKVIEECGESGDTFFAMRDYARIFRPKIIILENVVSAPWGRISNYMAAIGYSCVHLVVDTKNYYIPHTRQRGYMMCIDMYKEVKEDKRSKKEKELIRSFKFAEYMEKFGGKEIATYKSRMEFFKRPASSSVEAFLLEEDDPRVIAGRGEMTKSNSSDGKKRVVDWTRCQGRHEDYRFRMGLGARRYLTNWEDGGSCTPRDNWWPDWWKSQVERIWDHMEMSYLRGQMRGYDLESKFRIVDFSQNIDRSLDTGGSGLTGCVTPTGIPYSTMRGGPLIGLEALALQGLPVDTLILTREPQSKLQDLAGNAMSSTVVGAAILSALIARYEVLDRGDGMKEVDLNPTISETIDDPNAHRFTMNFDSHQPLQTAAAILAANQSSRACYCEGRSGMTDAPLQKCKACDHTTCVKCGISPKHEYVSFSPDRIAPTDFEQLLKSAIPMKIMLAGLSIDDIKEARKDSGIDFNATDLKAFNLSIDRVSRAVSSELRFHSLKRSNIWTASYESPCARLDLVFLSKHLEWRLYAKPEADLSANSPLRMALQYPIARMRPAGDDLVSGQWQIWVQKAYKFEASVEGIGAPVPDFFNVIGIATSADSFVFPQYEITVPEDVVDYTGVDLSGVYTLQQNCGMSQGSLHVKTDTVDPQKKTFLFHDPDRLGDPKDDFYVFSEDNRRLQYGEVRPRIARVDKKWRPLTVDITFDGGVETIRKGKKICTLSEIRHLDPMTCHVDGQWLDIPKASFNLNCETASGKFSRATNDFAITPSLTDCGESHVVLRCEATVPYGEISKYQMGHWLEIDELEQKEFFSEYAWLTDKVRVLPGLDTWREVENQLTDSRCATCAPAFPCMKWKLDEKNKIVPFEDPTQAAPFELAMKDRPSPLLTQLCIEDSGAVNLQLAINPQTLLHRAAAKLLGDDARSSTLQWRLVTDYVAPAKMSFPQFTLKNNDADLPAANPPGFKYPLRPEQLRSLHWMIQQEDTNVTPFIEEEVEESTIPLMGWRAEGRASRAKEIRGGVLADQVGFGKTITTLALIDTQRGSDEKASQVDVDGLIPLKATLILVPSQLPDQWFSEIRKFLPKSYRVTILKSLAVMDKYTVADFQEADIIIASWTVCEGDAYLFKLAQFAGVLELPEKAPARAQSAWYADAMKKVAENVDILKSNPSTLKGHIDANFAQEGKIATDAETYVPSKRLRGQAYQDYKEKLQLQKTRQKIAADLYGQDAPKVDEVEEAKPERTKAFTTKSRNDIFGLGKLSRTKKYTDMKSPIFEIFRFSRVVVDEYAYVAGEESLTIANLHAASKWVLSGTPPLQDFLDVKCMSKFLGVNLGIDDFTTGVMNAQNIKMLTKNLTSGEEFRTFKQKQSFAWHDNRHKLAQRFLDQFVRQNIADIEAINGSVHFMPVVLPAAERAIYLELQQLLAASDFKMVKGMKSLENDRMKRIRELLGQSDSVGEALMKCASHFTLDELHDGLNNAPDACAVIVNIRKMQLKSLEVDMANTLKQAEWLQLTCRDPCDQYIGVERQVDSNHFGDVDACEEIKEMMKDAFKNRDEDDWELFYMTLEQREDFAKAEAKSKAAAPAARKRKRASSESEATSSGAEQGDPVKLLPLLPKGRNGNVEYAHSALRDVTNTLRKMIVEYVSRKRCLRFFDCVRTLQKHYTDLRVRDEPAAGCACSKCGRTGVSPEEISILSQCGHTACDACHKKHEETFYNNLAVKEECLVQGCNAINKEWQVIRAPELGVEDDGTRQGRHYGKKIEDIVDLMQKIPADEQVLLFVQFTDLLDKIVGAFKDKGISYLALNKGDPSKTLTKFQTQTDDEKSKVLILNIGDASAAGSNLTNANHIIFVSPYLTDREQTYKAAMTQAVGRARRYGQTKAVHTYHFLSLKTIDVDSYESRNHVVLDHEDTAAPEYLPYEGFKKAMPMDTHLEAPGRESKWGSTVVTRGLLMEE